MENNKYTMTAYCGHSFSNDESDLKHMSDDVLVFADELRGLKLNEVYASLKRSEYSVVIYECNNRIRGIRENFIKYVESVVQHIKTYELTSEFDYADDMVIEAVRIMIYNMVLNAYVELTYDESEYLFDYCLSIF